MFNDEELKIYQNEFNKIDKNLNANGIMSILDYFYSFGVIAYEFYNNKEKKDCFNG